MKFDELCPWIQQTTTSCGARVRLVCTAVTTLAFLPSMLMAERISIAAPEGAVPGVEARSGGAWTLEGEVRGHGLPGAAGLELAPGASAAVRVEVPDLIEAQVNTESEWRGVVTLDLFGTVGEGENPGQIQLQLVSAEDGEVMASEAGEVPSTRAPVAGWTPIVSSAHGGARPQGIQAFDGNPNTIWHSLYSPTRVEGPHWIGFVLAEPMEFDRVRLVPRRDRGNGTPNRYHIEALDEGGEWRRVAEGGRLRSPVTLEFEPVTTRGLRVFLEETVGGFGALAQFEIPGIEWEPGDETARADKKIHLELSPEQWSQVADGSAIIRLAAAADSPPVVVGVPRAARLQLGGRTHFGRSNGGTGPDILRAGLLGFEAQTEHLQDVLRIISVREGSAAEVGGLQAEDLLVGIDGRALGINNLSAGWDWFHDSHEANIGRAIEAALSAERQNLVLHVLRQGEKLDLDLALGRTRPFTTLDPEEDPEAAAMLEDMISHILGSQRGNGSWERDSKRTTLAGLALLATGGEENIKAVRRAVDWLLERFPEPGNHGNLGFWSAGFTGKLLAEWHLQTGDERVLEPLEAMMQWAHDGSHPSAWVMPALGHGTGGLPYDNKALTAAALHMLSAEALAIRCGMPSRLMELLWDYMVHSWSDPEDGGHGALGYNASMKDLQEFWFRTGFFAMTLSLRGEREEMIDALTAIMRERHPWLRNSHAYGEPGGALGLVSLASARPEIFREIMAEYTWWFALAWEPGYGLRFTQPHMGAPYMGEDDLINPAYALVFQAFRRNLHLTGKEADVAGSSE